MILHADALTALRTLPDASAQTCVTSPPYLGLRSYNVDGQIGLETTVGGYICRLVNVFRQVRRVLKGDGTLWVVIGDSYAGTVGVVAIEEGRDYIGIDINAEYCDLARKRLADCAQQLNVFDTGEIQE